MGQVQNMCGENILGKFLSQHGDDAIKFISAQKSKLFIQDKFLQLTRRFHQAFQQFQSNISYLTENKQNQFSKAFQGLKNKANSVLPGGIAVLQRIKGQSINDFSGFNNIISQVESIKSQAMKNISLKKSHMMKKLEQQKANLKEQIEKQKPKIPFYDQLPQPLRKEVLKQAEKKFVKQLAKNQQSLDKKIMGLFNGSALNKMFQQMSPQAILQNLLGNGFGILEKNIFSNVTGGTTFGIGNAFNTLIK